MDKEVATQIAKIILRISELYDYTPEEIIGRGKRKRVSEVRYAIYMYLHYEVGLSSNMIGKYFKRSRYNILRGIRILRGWMEFHTETKEQYQRLVERLKDNS